MREVLGDGVEQFCALQPFEHLHYGTFFFLRHILSAHILEGKVDIIYRGTFCIRFFRLVRFVEQIIELFRWHLLPDFLLLKFAVLRGHRLGYLLAVLCHLAFGNSLFSFSLFLSLAHPLHLSFHVEGTFADDVRIFYFR